MHAPARRATFAAVTLLLTTTAALAQRQPIQITADLTDGSRHLYHAEIDIPVKAGAVALVTPQWIPGTHSPAGPAQDIVGVTFTANGEKLPWRRDDVNLYEFHLTAPKGVTSIHAHLDCIVHGRVTDHMAVLEWEKLLLYPANTPVRDIAIQPTVTVPQNWGIGTALTPETAYDPQHPGGGTVKYAVTNVEQLEDSPVITGQYFHEFALAPTVKPAHFIDVIADEAGDQDLRPKTLVAINNLVREADAMYASHHYNQYHFLLTLSDIAGGEGLEHGQSSDNGIGEKDFADDVHQLGDADLLSHEFTHSWNGKYRRPVNLYQADFATPQQGALLWVYEGMTQYLGNVLAARSGLKSQAQYRDLLAMSAAQVDYKVGREWRPTEDTAVSASLIRGGSQAWVNWRRSQDYYQEGELLWLDADTLIRKQTNDAKSLNDFEKIFLGKGGNTGPLIVPYDRAELVRDLNEVTPYDWAKFLHDRIDLVNARADLAGIEQGGYKLVYTDKPNPSDSTLAKAGSRRSIGSLWYSVGLRGLADGTISDVRWQGPSDKAHISPGEKIVAVNDIAFTPDVMRKAIKDGKGKSDPLHLLVQSENHFHAVDIDYHDGERYPRLQRVEGTPAYLDDITKPLTTPESAPAEKKSDAGDANDDD